MTGLTAKILIRLAFRGLAPVNRQLTTMKRKKSEISLKTKFEKQNEWYIKNNILCYNKNFYILKNAFCFELLKLNHDDFQTKHLNYDKTLKLLKRKYYWKKMSTNVRKYVTLCINCAKTKIFKYKLYKLLQFLSISKKFRQN